jgi:predicted transcriptional regulator
MSLGNFIIKQIEDKKVQRWIIPSEDLFVLCGNMGIIDDDDLMINVIEYLEENEIDVNFHGPQATGYYRRWNELEKMVTLRKMLNGSKTETQLMMEKVDSIKVPERPEWLEEYMDDGEEGVAPVKYEHQEEFARIKDMLTQELTDAVERETTPTMDGLIQRYNEMENEIIYRENPIMGEMNGEELRDFLTNRVIPERFKKNNNN